MNDRSQDGVLRFPMFDWRGRMANREGEPRMRNLKLHHEPDSRSSKNADAAAADGPFPFPVRRPKAPAFKPRLVTESVMNVEAALADVEKHLAKLHAMNNEDDDRPWAA